MRHRIRSAMAAGLGAGALAAGLAVAGPALAGSDSPAHASRGSGQLTTQSACGGAKGGLSALVGAPETRAGGVSLGSAPPGYYRTGQGLPPNAGPPTLCRASAAGR